MAISLGIGSKKVYIFFSSSGMISGWLIEKAEKAWTDLS